MSSTVVWRSALICSMNERIRSFHHIQPDCRLVQEEHRWFIKHGSREVPTHALAQAELPHRGVEEGPHLQQFHKHLAISAVFRLIHAVHLADQCQAFIQRQIPPELAPLTENNTDIQRVPGAILPGHNAAYLNLATGRHKDAAQHLDGGALSTFGEIAHDLAFVDAEADIVHCVSGGVLAREQRPDRTKMSRYGALVVRNP